MAARAQDLGLNISVDKLKVSGAKHFFLYVNNCVMLPIVDVLSDNAPGDGGWYWPQKHKKTVMRSNEFYIISQ